MFDPLAELRDRAERQLNVVRVTVLGLLTIAALAYAPSLTTGLRRANILILVPALAWTIAQYRIWYRRPRLPTMLMVVNPLVDVTAVTAIMTCYALTESAAVSLKAPMFLAYFVILAARPVTSSTRVAALVAACAVAEYALLVAFVVGTGRVALSLSPIMAAEGIGVSLQDESAKVLLLAVAGAVATYATAWHERLAIRAEEAARTQGRLEVELARAELESLKYQLQPHFLFNALNAITALVSSNPRAAERTVHGLSELLRHSLDSPAHHEVRLERELELLAHYIDIQRLRFQDRLRVHLAIDPDARRALVPNLLLHPLVENAIRHGIGSRAEGGSIDVRAACVDGRLHLQVSDNGIGGSLPPNAHGPSREGVGLGNTRARLRYLYGDAQHLIVTTAPGAGWIVDVELPYHT
jgi:two-component sensor histidine kinase